MGKKRSLLLVTTLIACLSMTACGESVIPDMTPEELEAIGEYAAFTLMKYDAKTRSRLVELKPETEQVTPEPESEPEANEPSGMRPTDDTTVVDAPGLSEQDQYTLEEALGLPEGIELQYTGFERCKTYTSPDDSGMATIATPGNDLLVAKFMLKNVGDGTKKVIIENDRYSFRITVNETTNKKVLFTMQSNDMFSYTKNIAAGDSKELVLIIEVNENLKDDFDKMSLSLKNDSKTYTIRLK